MPSGQTHDRITLWLLPWITGITLLLSRSSKFTLVFTSCFIFSGLMFGPDLDIYSVQFKRWGKFRFIWIPYQKFLRHRSKLSHGFIIGTVIRLLYLLTWITVISIFLVGITQLVWGFDWNWQEFFSKIFRSIKEKHPIEAIAFFFGLELGAMTHSLSDWGTSAYKQYQKNGIKAAIGSKTTYKPRQKRKKTKANPRS